MSVCVCVVGAWWQVEGWGWGPRGCSAGQWEERHGRRGP